MSHSAKLFALFCTTAAVGAIAEQKSYSPNGTTGYIDMPSALTGEAGDTSLSFFKSDLATGQRLQFQATDHLSIGAETSDNIYTGEEATLDLRYQLYDGDGFIPAIAVGVNDAFGIGSRSSEYIVATSKIGQNFELSAGIGWGAMGTHGNDAAENDRIANDPTAFSSDHYFSGSSAMFAGGAWHTPIRGLSLNAEYASIAWDAAVADGFERGDLSYGLTYRPSEKLAISLFSRNGDDFGGSLTIGGNPYKPLARQATNKAPVTVVPRAALGVDFGTAWSQGAATSQTLGPKLKDIIENEGYSMKASRVTADRIDIEINEPTTFVTPQAIGRISRALAMAAPASVENFAITIMDSDNIPTSTVIVNRSALEKQQGQFDAGQLSLASSQIVGGTKLSGSDVYRVPKQNSFSVSGGFSKEGSFTDDQDPLLLIPSVTGKVQSTIGLSATAKMSLNIGDKERVVEPSDIGVAIRSDSADYRRSGTTLDRLSADYKFKMGTSLYGRVSAGYLDTQFAGLDGEILYAPAQSPFAVGLQVAQVTKRAPDSYFDLGDYKTTTGHITGYWDTGYQGIELSASYGRYLAEDWGNTFGVSKKFANGWEVAGKLTASEHFYDSQDTSYLVPEIQVQVPLKWGAPFDMKTKLPWTINNSSTDAGRTLDTPNGLYDSVRDYDAADYTQRWGGFWQ